MVVRVYAQRVSGIKDVTEIGYYVRGHGQSMEFTSSGGRAHEFGSISSAIAIADEISKQRNAEVFLISRSGKDTWAEMYIGG